MSDYRNHDPTTPQKLLDRYRGNWHQRLAIGLAIDRQFRNVEYALVLTKGSGRWMSHQWSECGKEPIPPPLAERGRQFVTQPSAHVADLAQFRLDLCDVLVTAANRAKLQSGKAADRVLTIGLFDRGLTTTDFDGRVSWETFCAPEPLAEQTGLTIVDAFAARDLANGGRGEPVHLLAAWFLLADRRSTVATEHRLLVQLGESTELAWLPPSDGLDEEFPAIHYQQLPGRQWLIDLVQEAALEWPTSIPTDATNPPSLEAQVRLWQAASRTTIKPQGMNLNSSMDVSEKPREVGEHPAAAGELRSLFRQQPALFWQSFASFLIESTASTCRQWVAKSATQGQRLPSPSGDSEASVTSVPTYLFAPPVWRETWTDQLESGDSSFPLHLAPLRGGLPGDHAAATLGALLGLMTLDQTPGTTPALTGCRIPRPLGRLTPGSPMNWRQVIMYMSDCQPPAMKLRDAI